MRMMMAQKETIERELAKLQVLLAPYTHTHTRDTTATKRVFENNRKLLNDQDSATATGYNAAITRNHDGSPAN